MAISPGPLLSDEQSGRARPHEFTVYSGGDDSIVFYVECSLDDEVRSGELSLQTPYPPTRIKGHTAGVVSILPLPIRLPQGLRIVVTGSYDDYLRVYAVSPFGEAFGAGKARLVAEENLGGGVWRLKLLDISPNIGKGVLDAQVSWTANLLASCMHAGVRVLKIQGNADGSFRIIVVAGFQEHKSMNYGSDCQPGVGVAERLCVSTSFYDKLLCLWSLEEDNLRKKT